MVFHQTVDMNSFLNDEMCSYLLLFATGAREASFRNIKTMAVCLAEELVNAASRESSNLCAER